MSAFNILPFLFFVNTFPVFLRACWKLKMIKALYHTIHFTKFTRFLKHLIWKLLVTQNFFMTRFYRLQRGYKKWEWLLHPITWLFLDRFLIFWHVSYRAWKMHVIDANRIKISPLIWDLRHFKEFKDKWSKLECGNLLWMLPPWQFQLRLASAKHYGHKTALPKARALSQLELD